MLALLVFVVALPEEIRLLQVLEALQSWWGLCIICMVRDVFSQLPGVFRILPTYWKVPFLGLQDATRNSRYLVCAWLE